jgi:hypothetical protein
VITASIEEAGAAAIAPVVEEKKSPKTVASTQGIDPVKPQWHRAWKSLRCVIVWF